MDGDEVKKAQSNFTLDPFGISQNSLSNLPFDAISGYKFDTNLERDAITTSKIRNFTFNAGTGGTITLGGTANGNGVLNVRNSLGSTAITLNNIGITINSGTLAIFSSSGSTIIDSEGLNSTNNFQNGQIFNGAAAATTTSTSFVDVPGGVVGTITTDRSVNVLFSIMGYGYNSGLIESAQSDIGELALYDSVPANTIMNVIIAGVATSYVTFPGPGTTNVTDTVGDQMVSRDAILALDAGTHSLKLQYRADIGGSMVLDAYLAALVVLGQ